MHVLAESKSQTWHFFSHKNSEKINGENQLTTMPQIPNSSYSEDSEASRHVVI